MSEALKKIEGDVITAMKAKDRTRLDILRQFVNRIKMAAKNDTKNPNRAVVDEDVVEAGLKIVKEANETRDIYVSKGVDTTAQDDEIRIVSEYLPRKMSENELREILTRLSANAPEGKSAKGYYMKELNGNYRGQFDNRVAQTLVDEIMA